MFSLSRQTLALITSLSIVLVALFILSSNTQPSNTPSSAMSTQPTPTPIAQTIISLTPNPLPLTPTTEGVVEVKMNTAENEVTAIQLEILYDPDVLTNVVIKPGPLFTNPVPIVNTIDKQEGRISYALTLAPGQTPVKSQGIVAIITFNKNPRSTITATDLKLLPRTIVVAKGIGPSVLKQAIGTTIKFSTI